MISFSEGQEEYFPGGFHDSFFTEVHLDLENAKLAIVFSPYLEDISDYKLVRLVALQVSDFRFSGVFEVLVEDDEVMALEMKEKHILIEGRKWSMEYSFEEIGWIVES